MTGHVYSYSVRTAGEFKRHVAKDYQISPRYLHLLEPEEIQEMDEKGEPSRTVNKYDDEPLLPDVVYYLLCDTLPTQTLMKGIIPTEINSQLQIESTTYRIPLEELIRYPSSCFDYLALYPERLEIVEEYIHKLTDRGWKRLFLNSAALPLMEKHEDLLHHHFVLNGHILAMLPEGVPMITRLLQEGIYPDVVGEFWNNLNRN